jgi:2-polyprenyl-3-methyl-5-hydroxy-6-metoxy-1,4-benzoquinol methylase
LVIHLVIEIKSESSKIKNPMREFWDARYEVEEFVYGKEPNRFLSGELIKMNPGRILLPGEGEGRNAVFAASLGWKVDAIDQSQRGAKKALQFARDHNLTINYRVSSIETVSLSKETYDVVGIVFVHLPPSLRTVVHSNLVDSLKPGGRVILEAFHRSQLGRSSGGPQSENMLYTAPMLLNDFKNLEVFQLQEIETELDEGVFHQGNARVVRYIGFKPA